MSVPSADHALRGPQYAMIAWLFGPLLTVVLAIAHATGVLFSEHTMGVFASALFVLVHCAGVVASVVVFRHRAVRHCTEGWLLAGYWCALATFVTIARWDLDLPGWLGLGTLYALPGLAGLLPLVFVLRIVATGRAASG
jgi:hypothetical protein